MKSCLKQSGTLAGNDDDDDDDVCMDGVLKNVEQNMERRSATRTVTKRKSTTRRTAVDKKVVDWGEVVVHEFPNILGDNPGVSEGVPLTIGWKPIGTDTIPLDFFECMRSSQTSRLRRRRTRQELILSAPERDSFLLGQGYLLSELLETADEMSKIRKSRQQNIKGGGWGSRLFFGLVQQTTTRTTTTTTTIGQATKTKQRTSLPRIIAARSG